MTQEAQAASQQRPLRLGPYILEGVAGTGGMGVVYRAHDVRTGRAAAVKTVLSARPVERAALRSEALALRQIDHPGIVPVWDTGEADGAPWYAMPLLEGTPLASLMPSTAAAGPTLPALPGTSQPPAAMPELLPLFVELCDAVAAMHAANVVHRDLKPANVFVCDGHPVLLDFGLAEGWVAAVERERLRSRPGAAGTVHYLAPEVLRGELADPRADLYALGVMLFEACTATRPFDGAATALIHQHLHVPAPDPRTRRPEVPAALAELVLALLAKEPIDRPAGAQQVARQLARAIGRPAPSTPRPPPWCRSTLVGRADDVRRLEEALGRGVVVVSGEAGAGKTRLLATLAHGSQAGHVWPGQCADSQAALGGGLAPARPALADLAMHASADPELLGAIGPHLLALAPFEDALGRLATAAHLPEPPDLDGPPARERALEAARATMVALATDGGALWLVDDLQLADELTLALLENRARFPEAWPRVQVACALRSEERADTLLPLLGSPGVTEVRIENLDPASIEALLGASLGTRAPPPSLVAEVLAHAGGNPCFVGELLQEAITDGRLTWTEDLGWAHRGGAAQPPASIRAAALQRVAALGPGRTLAQRAALFGEVVDVRLLTGDDAGLRELVDRRVLLLKPDGTATFSHPTLRDAALESVLPDARAAAHRDAALTLEREIPEASGWRDRARARHWIEAGEPARAWPALVAAADRAHAEFAHHDAARLLAQAITIGREVGAYRASPAAEADHLLTLGTIHATEGQFAEARAEIDEALVIRGLPSGPRRWTSLVGVLVDQVLRRLLGRRSARTTDPDVRFAATAHVVRTWVGMQGFDPGYLLDAVLRSLGANEALGPDASPEPYAYVGTIASMTGLASLGRRYFQLADAHMDGALMQPRLRALAMQGLAGLLGGDFPSAQRTNERGAQLAHDAGERVIEGFFLHQAAHCAFYRGRSDEALAFATRQPPHLRAGLGDRYLQLTNTMMRLHRGDAEAALDDMEPRLATLERDGGGAALIWGLALVAKANADLGRSAAARAALDRCEAACATVSASGPPRHPFHLFRPWVLLRIDGSDPQEIHHAATEAVAYFRRVPMCLAMGHAALAAAEARRGQPARALRAATQAFALADRDDAALAARMAGEVLVRLPETNDRDRARAQARIDAVLAAGPCPPW